MTIPDRQKQRQEYLRKQRIADLKTVAAGFLFFCLLSIAVGFGGLACLMFLLDLCRWNFEPVWIAAFYFLSLVLAYPCWLSYRLMVRLQQKAISIPFVPPVIPNTPGREEGVRQSGREIRLPRLSKPIRMLLVALATVAGVSFLCFSYLFQYPGDNAAIVRFKLELGADPNQRDTDGETLLYKACYNDWPHTVQVLLEHGADPDTRDEFGNTPLFFASTQNQPNTILLLLQHGADINARNLEGETTLMGNRFLADRCFLVEHGADVNAVDNDGRTALIHVVDPRPDSPETLSTLRYLLEQGARVSIKDKQGKTTLDYARAIDCSNPLYDPSFTQPKKTELINLLEAALKKEQSQKAGRK
jgi:hypothetical protein